MSRQPQKPRFGEKVPGAVCNKDAKEHDKNVAILPPHTVIAAAQDLCSRSLWNTKNPEERWLMERKAALVRRIVKENLQQLAHA